MNEITNKLKQIWFTLQVREKALISLCFLLFFFVLCYSFLYQPWSQEKNRAQLLLKKDKENLSWMIGLDEKYPLIKKVNTLLEKNNQSLLSIINTSAKTYKIKETIQSMSSVRNKNEITLNHKSIQFNLWLQWTQSLEKKGVVIKSVFIQSESKSLVTIRATFLKI